MSSICSVFQSSQKNRRSSQKNRVIVSRMLLAIVVAAAAVTNSVASATTTTASTASSSLSAPRPLIGAHYFSGWYNCSTLAPGCFSHFQGFTPRGEPVDNFFTYYPERLPLLGLYSTSLSTVVAEVHAADKALDFFQVLFYDGEVSCGFNQDPNLEHCLNSALAFMLNSTEVWEGTSRLHFYLSYSNDVDSGRPGMFVGSAGELAFRNLAATWVKAMSHERYLKINNKPLFQILIPDIFVSQCGGNSTLANELLALLRSIAVDAGVGTPVIGGGWLNPSVPGVPGTAPLPHPQGYMQYNTTDIPCESCNLARIQGATFLSCSTACNTTGACTAFVLYSNSTCQLKSSAGPGAPGGGNTFVRVLDPVNYEWRGTYNDAQPVCPDQPNWECQRYINSWFPNATSNGAKLFPYDECSSYQAEARGNQTHDPVPYLPNVIAGFDPRPWEEHSASFIAPTGAEFEAALQQLYGILVDPDNHVFGFPDESAPNGIQPAGSIYAWNEFGEGGICAPTAGSGTAYLDALTSVFGK